jgi:hypothetical protein
MNPSWSNAAMKNFAAGHKSKGIWYVMLTPSANFHIKVMNSSWSIAAMKNLL